MKNFPFLYLIDALRSVYKDCSWNGWIVGGEVKAPYSRSISRGSYTAFEAHINGYTITIKEHDYHHCLDEQGRVENHRHVFVARDLDPEKNVTWIEIDVHDMFRRFGRAAIVDELTIPVGTYAYEQAKEMFDAIKAIGKVHRYNLVDRLSKERSAIGFCRDLKALSSKPPDAS